MASVATAASQPGVSVVSMSWGFPEGQAVFAADEATYDSVFNVPGVTFVASTGDYGAADPEYPAFSPNVVAVGGTSLTLNADNSYNSETGWGYRRPIPLGRSSAPAAASACTSPSRLISRASSPRAAGPRPTSRWSPIRPPAPGSPTRTTCDRQQPVRDRGRHEPVGPGLGGLARPGQPGPGRRRRVDLEPRQPDRDPASPLQCCPRAITTRSPAAPTATSADAGYNLVTGLGTPVANLLVPDLIAYQGTAITDADPTDSPL